MVGDKINPKIKLNRKYLSKLENQVWIARLVEMTR
jgi:hypothetical protein